MCGGNTVPGSTVQLTVTTNAGAVKGTVWSRLTPMAVSGRESGTAVSSSRLPRRPDHSHDWQPHNGSRVPTLTGVMDFGLDVVCGVRASGSDVY